MKQIMFVIALLVVGYLATGFCQAADEGNEQLQAARKQMELREVELGAEKMETEAHLYCQMQELELQERRIQIERQQKEMERAGNRRHRHKRCVAPFLMICFVVHILTAVWVYQDIRKRNGGSGIWIVITLLAGLLGGLVYAVVRLGDIRQT